ncbi:MAG: gliding motility-associated C-terminal domain-containing protein [Candidatus Latescibacterota bacterium]|nr:gliding motility-associated C-terminal domain-containing protein [Candidatus Latescibacterota bacterium]
MIRLLTILCGLLALSAHAQPVRTLIIGEGTTTWQSGGFSISPKVVASRGRLDTTNTPGNAIDYDRRPGWISPLFFDGAQNIAARVLEGNGRITSPDVGRGFEEQFEGIVNGSPSIAFIRKPTAFDPEVNARGIRVVLDFFVPVGVERVRFYPRNTVTPNAATPFHADFMRGYELWVNPARTSLASPDILVERNTENEEPIVDIAVPPQYVRILMLKSLVNVPFEIDELEVYGTGFLQRGQYLTDIIDLGERATIGPIRWVEDSIADPEFSELEVRVRTGHDGTPLHYRRILPRVPGTPGPREVEFVTPDEYFRLDSGERAPYAADTDNWSPNFPVANGQLITAPSPRRYVQFQVDFAGGLFESREMDRLEFDYITPPIADELIAEVFPRLAQAEEPAIFRYAVRLRQTDEIRGFDRLEVDTNVAVTDIREVKVDGIDIPFDIEFIREEGFAIRFPLITADTSLLELTFDLPIFRFGTTFSGRAYNSRALSVPQALVPGHAVDFGPGDIDELSGLAVAIPKPQIGKLVGEIAIKSRVFTPNGDGVNEAFEVFFNILQLTRDAPIRFEVYDLSGRRLHSVFAGERGIGPVTATWDGRLADGGTVVPGTYVWALRVEADAFDEVHTGTMAVTY